MKIRQLLSLSLLIIGVGLSSCDNQPEPLTPPEETGFMLPADVTYPDIQIDPKQDSIPMSGKEVFDYVKALFDRGIDFEWSMADDYVFWSAVIAGDSTVALGYKPADVEEIDYATLDIQSYDYQYARAYTLEFILREMRRLHPGKTFTEEDIIQKEQKLLPLMYLKIYDYEVIAKLRKLETIDYLEPHGYQVEEYGQIRSLDLPGDGSSGGSSGCREDCESGCPTTSDYFTISPNSKVAWNVGSSNHNVATANGSIWDICPAGDDITIALIDTGIDPDNDYLDIGGLFAVGMSSNRTLEKINMFDVENEGTNADDQCGHGTRMAALLAHPRNNGGGITGMAYRANLVSYRAGNDAVIGSNSKVISAVVDAFEDIASRPDIDVVSMSMGSNTKKSSINAAIMLAYSQGKLIFCAAGSGGFKIHPAKSMPTEIVAVTGVLKQVPGSHTNLTAAQGCPAADYVDFAMYTEQSMYSSTRYGISTALNQGDDITWSQQSSCATALCAGIAASVWSANPSLSRSQVLNILQYSASMGYNRDNDFGWGIIDAPSAVNAAIATLNPPLGLVINGPATVTSYGLQTWTAVVSNASTSNLSYSWQWDSGTPGTSSSYSQYFYPSGSGGSGGLSTHNLVLTVTEQGGNNQSITTSQQVIFDPPN